MYKITVSSILSMLILVFLAPSLVSCSAKKESKRLHAGDPYETSSKSAPGGGENDQSTSNNPQEQDLRKAVRFAKKHSMLASETSDPGRSNAWFVDQTFQDLTGGEQFSDDAGFVASPFPQISEEDTPIRASRPSTDWPKNIALCFNRPTSPWSIVVRRDLGKKSIVVDAYGEDQTKPLFSETIYERR